MWDRYDPRDDDRDPSRAWTRDRGGRGAAADGERDRLDDDRSVFVRDLDLPRGEDREFVRDRDRTFAISGRDSRLLATVGAFRVIAERDLDRGDAAPDVRRSVRHLHAEGLLRAVPSGPDDRVVVLTDRGRDLLESSRRPVDDGRRHDRDQAFYAGLRKPRELTHDTQVYRAYLRAEERLRSQGGRVRRVVLDYELKRDYQRFLQARNRGRKDSDGRPDREPDEIRLWAREHQLPYFDEQVHFPDLRIEYDDRDRSPCQEDIEVTTGHYRGAHAAAAARSGFTRYRGVGGLAGGRRGGGRRGGSALPRLAEELL